ncbi:MAG: protein kinase [Alphaproteobacteria bacterium]|nr:protein kinase [Alphaproteobacteria bacterium]
MSEGRRFQVVRQLGKGGFGVVYLARMQDQGQFSTLVALKVLHPEASRDPEIGGRLRDEARILGQLRHRAIVRVQGLMRWQDQWTVIMEYVPGADVHQLLRSGPLPPRAALGVVTEVSGALDAAFNRPGLDGAPLNLLHRDIKPQNIRITPDGDVKLLDFGIARAEMDSRESLTRASVAFGTPDYMAPERMDFSLEEREHHVGDVYSLGVVLYEMLTATRYGRNSPAEQRHRALLDDAFAKLRERLSPADAERVVPLLESMLAFDPEARPAAAEVKRRCRELMRQVSGQDLASWAEDTLPAIGQTLKVEDPGELPSYIQEDGGASAAPLGEAPDGGGRGVMIGVAALMSLLVLSGGALGAWLVLGGDAAPAEERGATRTRYVPSEAQSAEAPAIEPVVAPPSDAPAEPTRSPDTPKPVTPARTTPEPAATVPERSPAAEPAPPPVRGVPISLDSDAEEVWLISADGARHDLPAATVAPGKYELYARFEVGGRASFGTFTVKEGDPVGVKCRKAMTRCVWR